MVQTQMPRLRPAQLVTSLLPLGLAFLAAGIAVAVTMPFLSLFLSTEVHAGPARVTLFLVLAPLSGVIASTVVGRLSDRRPIRRQLMIVAALTGVAGCGLTAVVRNYWVLLALAVTAVSLAGTLFPQTLAYARHWMSVRMPDRAALGMSGMRTIVSVAWVGGPPLAAVLIEVAGFRTVYLLAAVLYAVVAAIAIFRLDEVDAPPAVAPAAAGGESTRWTLWLTAAAFVLLQTPLTLGAQSLPFLTTEKLGGDIGDAGLALGLCAALEIPLMLGLGVLATRVSLRGMVLAGAGCGVGYYALVAAANGVGMLLAAQLLNALFIAAVAGLGITYMQDMLPHSPGRSTTLFTNTFPIGAMLAGPLFGLAQHAGIRLAFVMCAVSCLLGLAILAVVRGKPAALSR